MKPPGGGQASSPGQAKRSPGYFAAINISPGRGDRKSEPDYPLYRPFRALFVLDSQPRAVLRLPGATLFASLQDAGLS